jgi:hypothetical protein
MPLKISESINLSSSNKKIKKSQKLRDITAPIS